MIRIFLEWTLLLSSRPHKYFVHFQPKINYYYWINIILKMIVKFCFEKGDPKQIHILHNGPLSNLRLAAQSIPVKTKRYKQTPAQHLVIVTAIHRWLIVQKYKINGQDLGVKSKVRKVLISPSPTPAFKVNSISPILHYSHRFAILLFSFSL